MTVEQAYGEVERLTRARARNFAYGIMLLPRPKRRAIAAIYAFARRVDDLADGDLPAIEKRRRLEALHDSLQTAPDGEALWVALADARRRYPIPGRALHDLVDGGLQDLDRQRYADFEELLGYCRRVAGAVGVACTAVYGADQPQRAEALGVALQLINIMRDVAEEDIAAGRCTGAWQALMAHQAVRARAYLAEGLTLLSYLDRRSSACVATFAGLYRATLDRIERAGYDVFSGPPVLSPLTKLRIVGAGLIR